LRREFKAVFFDLDGTLVDIHGPLYIAARNALDQLGHKPRLTRDHYHQALARDDIWLGIPPEMRPEYLKLAYAYLVAELDRTERLEVLPRVHETLAEIRRRGYATAIVTSRPGDARRLVENSRWWVWRLISIRWSRRSGPPWLDSTRPKALSIPPLARPSCRTPVCTSATSRAM
jgi:FMN phosphatase YigB (HAD superfamily)